MSNFQPSLCNTQRLKKYPPKAQILYVLAQESHRRHDRKGQSQVAPDRIINMAEIWVW